MSSPPSNQNTAEQLREKIKSKMDVAKFFAGFITVFLGVAFRDLSNLAADSSRLVSFFAQAGMLFILGALAFSVSTMFAYDRLMMPPALWKVPPSNDDIYHQMVDAWQRLFVPAVATLFISLLSFIIAVTKQLVPSLVLWIVPMIAALLCYRAFSKRQGFID
jgi:hypothetical protein